MNVERFKIEEYNKPLFDELRYLGCEYDPTTTEFSVPENKKPNFSEVKNFYFEQSKSMTPFQKKFKTYLEKNLPLDITIKKTDKGMFLVDENDLIEKQQLKSLLDKVGAKIVRCMNGKRYLIGTEGAFGNLPKNI